VKVTGHWGRPIPSPNRGDALKCVSVEPPTEFARWQLRRGLAVTEVFEDNESEQRRTPRQARVEAALLVADGALSARRISQCAALLDAGEAKQVVDELNAAYDNSVSAFRIERVGAGYQMLTRPVFARWLDRVHHRQERLKLSNSALETLAVVAYRQPITRADIEAVRGVAASEMLKQLMERGLVKIVGEDDSLGRPYLYGTTRQFLEAYGLRSLEDMPLAENLRKPAAKGTVKTSDRSLAAAPEASDEDAPALAG
jgi:segregation and condensation protein B